MKTAEDYLEELDGWLVPSDLPGSLILEKQQLFLMINIARKETIKEFAKMVRISNPYQDGRRLGLREGNLENYVKNNPPRIEKQSILSLINELK